MDSSQLLNSTQSHTVDIDSLIDTARLAAGLQKCLLQSRSLLRNVFSFIDAHYQDDRRRSSTATSLCVQEIAAILYNNTADGEVRSLEDIEKTLRQQMLEHVSVQP